MNCTHCKTQFDRPLEIFTGNWQCPNCLADIFPNSNTKLAITTSNHTLFKQSEYVFYNQWLKCPPGTKEAVKSNLLRTAISLCEDSAYQNNPYALVNLGYYYEKGYAVVGQSQLERTRYAIAFYRAVLFNENAVTIDIDGNAKSLPTEQFNQLRIIAGCNILSLVSHTTTTASGALSAKALEALANVVVKKLNALGYNEGTFTIDNTASNTIDTETIFNSICKPNNTAGSLFGIYYLSGKQLAQLNEYKYTALNGVKVSLGQHINKNDKLKLLIATAKSSSDAESYRWLTNANQLPSLLSGKDDMMFFLFYYNYSNKKPKLQKSHHQKILNCLQANDFQYISSMISNNMYDNFTFSEDDMIYFSNKGKKNYSEAIKSLIQKVGDTL